MITNYFIIILGVVKCSECNKEFFTSYSYNLHLKSHLNDHPFKCEDCGLNLSSKTTLQRHKTRIHATNQDARPFHCDNHDCDKSFISEAELKLHQVKHTKDKNFLCEECGMHDDFQFISISKT